MTKNQVWRLALLFAIAVPCTAQPPRKLIVVSVDGLDWRYLRDRDALHLRIPNMRRLLHDGSYASGVIGVWPTITWPSHTSLITGVRPDQHGIEGNRRPQSEGGDYYWNVHLLQSPTLWKLAHDQGRTTASITWPVTVGATIDYNLPEYFHRRQGGSMDLESIASQATPGLVAEIAKAYPSFPQAWAFQQAWVDDRTRTLAALFLLRDKKPDLLLIHLVDLDAEEHEQGPYTENADAVVERTDELIGDLLKALPPGYVFALVSDHGFERVDKIANPRVLLAQNHLPDSVESFGGILTTSNENVAQFLRTKPEGIGTEIPKSEIEQYAPNLSSTIAAFQPADHVLFGSAAQGAYFTPPAEKGNHGFWPARHDYRSVFCLDGPGIPPGELGEIQMLTIASRLAAVLSLHF